MIRLRVPWRLYAGAGAMLLLGAAAIIAAYPSQRLLGAMFEADQNLDQALVYYRAWARSHPTDFDARWHTATLELAVARPTDAIATLEAMADDWPANKAVLEKLVDIEDSLLHVRGVIPRLDAITEHYPDDLATLRRLADHQRWFGNTDALLDVLERLAAHPDAVEERFELADILLANRHYERLIEVFTAESVATRVRDAYTRQFIAEAQTRMGEPERATETLLGLLEDHPESTDALAAIADIWIADDRPDLVESYLARATAVEAERRNRVVAASYAEGSAKAAANGDMDRAVQLARRRIAVVPDSLEARLALSELYGDQADAIAAIELRLLSERRADDVAVWRLLAQRLSWLGRTKEAVQALDEAIALEPQHYETRRERARVLLDGRKVDASIAEYRGIALATRATADVAALFDVLFAEGRYRAAVAVGDRLKRATSSQKRRLALAMSWTHNCAPALEHLRELTVRFPDDTMLWRARRDCAIEVGDPDDALIAAARLRGRSAQGGKP